MNVKAVKLADLIPDSKNANKGTLRGRAMLEDVLRKYGAARSIVVDKHGHIIAGNKTTEAAVDIGIDDAIVVETTGDQLVVVKRTDVDLDSEAGRAIAIADNRAGEVGLEWDAEVLEDLLSDGVNLAEFFDPDELSALLNETPDLDSQDPASSGGQLCTCPKCGHQFSQ